jgi:hypothetical protein
MGKKQEFLESLLLIFLCGLALSCVAYGYTRLIMRYSLPNAGSIHTVGIAAYWTNDTNDPATALTWPILYPDSNASVTLWMLNNGTVPVQLSFTNDSWNPPEPAQYLNTTWSADGQILAVGQWLETTYTLTVSPACQNITSYSFDITFIGSKI